MDKTSKLDYTMGVKLRRAYGMYKDLNRSDYSDFDEYKEDKKFYFDELAKVIGDTGLNIDLYNIEEYIYSKNQLKFIEDAECGNGDLHYGYSGRGMFGDVCPALYCDSHNDITTKARTQMDSMGKGVVIYAQN